MAKAIAGLKDGKAPELDGIPAEVWKQGGDNLFSRLHQLITKAWEVGSVPQAWKDVSIVTIYKKGDRTDDSALVAHSAEEMQKIVNDFSDASKKFGLKINIKKTEVMYQPNSTRTREEDIMVDGNMLNSVLEFTSEALYQVMDALTMKYRGGRPSASFGQLGQTLWNNHHVSMRVKGKIYRAIVLSTLLYGAEAWTADLSWSLK